MGAGAVAAARHAESSHRADVGDVGVGLHLELLERPQAHPDQRQLGKDGEAAGLRAGLGTDR